MTSQHGILRSVPIASSGKDQINAHSRSEKNTFVFLLQNKYGFRCDNTTLGPDSGVHHSAGELF